MHCSLKLIVQTLVFSRSYLHRQVFPPETLAVKGGTIGREMAGNLAESSDFHATLGIFLHAANPLLVSDGFTSPPKEGVLRIFSPRKIRRLRSGLNPWTWVPLGHRSRLRPMYVHDDTAMIYFFSTMVLQPPSGPRRPHYWGFMITLRHTTLG